MLEGTERVLGTFWVLSVALAIAIVGAAALHTRPGLVSWSVCCIFTSIIAGAIYMATVYFGNGKPNGSSNSPIAGYAVFVAAPMLATFGIERVWFRLGRAVSRPLTTTVLSVPLGILTYAFSLFVALIIAVNVGILEP